MAVLEVSYFVAFLGGALTLLPACGPALVPAFFAFGFTGKPLQALKALLVFGLGFSLLFLPFSLGVKVFVEFLSLERQTAYTIAGLLLLAAAIIPFFGLPVARVYFRGQSLRPLGMLGLGLAFGLTSAACTAPIYGSITTLSAISASWLQSSVLLFAFELGLFLPLALLAVGINLLPAIKRVASVRFAITIFGFRRVVALPVVVASVIHLVIGLAFLLPRFSYALFPLRAREYITSLMFSFNYRLLLGDLSMRVKIIFALSIILILLGIGYSIARNYKEKPKN